jgi:hypothetical protein
MYSLDKEAGVVFLKFFLARRIGTERRCDAGFGVGGGQPGSNVGEGRSLEVDQRS